MDEQPPTDPSSPGFVPVCAIGASAGGVTALQTLFRLLPDDLGLAYVVVVHLSPNHPSAMHEILGACTRMPVFQVEDGPQLKANCVYVIAPDRELVIDGDDVKSRPFSDPRGRRAPIDMFFRSVAAGRGDGIAVVLTGAGSDGSLGVRAIKEAGGIVMVQEPSEAGFPSMPQNAIATGGADVIAPLSRLAERIAEAARSKEAVRSLEGDGAANDVRRIVAFLRTRTGHDFSGYKRSTVQRRISRRMQICRILTLPDYATYIRGNPEEAKELLGDLLISVTMFFRDPIAFVALSQRAIRPLLESRAAGETDSELRAWVVGCATGEEAYSLAILLLEEAERLKMYVPIQIFATDLDEGALATAREGCYARSIEADVSAERLKHFFVDEGTHYRVNRQLRDTVLFATHSVVREPPFMRLDLITCRNVLIYLESSLQQHVCAIFHYGLKDNGYLFLGTAETADTSLNRFAAVDRDARVYRALPAGHGPLPTLVSTSISSMSRPLLTEGRVAVSRFEAGEILGASHAAALEASAPPSALVDAEHAVLHLSPTAGRFILLSAGPLSGSLPSIVRPELRLDLKLALDRVFDAPQPTITRLIDVELEGKLRRVSLHIVPVSTNEGVAPRAVVYFLDNGPSRPVADSEPASPLDELRHLHSELKVAQEAQLAGRLRQESAVQELRASNEELQSLNEEYRSTAEELETSKEELQSINEELQTVNAELKSKLSLISAAHNDLQNLTASSEIGTLFLDLELRIRMFTPPVAELINVTEIDVGRPITNFTRRFEYDGIEPDVRRVMRDLTPTEREIRALDDRWFMVRIRPYRTLDGRIEGAVVIFNDITDRKRREAELRESEAKYRRLFHAIDTGYCVITVIFDDADKPVDYVFVEANRAFIALTGLKNAIGKSMRELVPDHEEFWFQAYGSVVRTGQPERFEHRAEALGRWYSVYALRIEEPERRQIAILFEDVTARKILEMQTAFLDEISQHLARLSEPEEIMQTICGRVGEFLDVSSCMFHDVDEARGQVTVHHAWQRGRQPDLKRTFQFDDYLTEEFSRANRAGESFVVRDTGNDERTDGKAYARLHIGAFVVAPFLSGGRWTGYLSVTSVGPRDWRHDEVRLLKEIAGRLFARVEQTRSEAAVRRIEERQRLTLQLVPAMLWWADRTGRDIADTDQWRFYTSQEDGEPQEFGWRAVLHPDDLEATSLAYEHAFATGEPFERQQRIFHKNDGYRWHLVRHIPVRDANGVITRWFNAAIDVDELHQLQDRQQVLVGELQHRTRNLLGIVRSIMDATMRVSASVGDFAEKFRDRLAALARVQTLLSRLKIDDRITFDELIRNEFSALGYTDGGFERIVLAGPGGVALRSSTLQTFALALHELATNAVKYGALAQASGRLAVTWRLERDGMDGKPWLHVDWRESGVAMPPADAAPHGTGQGRQLIEQALPYQLGAKTTYVMGADGVQCSIAVPVSSRMTAEEI